MFCSWHCKKNLAGLQFLTVDWICLVSPPSSNGRTIPLKKRLLTHLCTNIMFSSPVLFFVKLRLSSGAKGFRVSRISLSGCCSLKKSKRARDLARTEFGQGSQVAEWEVCGWKWYTIPGWFIGFVRLSPTLPVSCLFPVSQVVIFSYKIKTYIGTLDICRMYSFSPILASIISIFCPRQFSSSHTSLKLSPPPPPHGIYFQFNGLHWGRFGKWFICTV
jgi:hypothetical protein